MADWICAYNSNGFAHHRLEDALRILAELGYGGVALTLDVHHLDPFADGHERACRDLARLLEELQLDLVIESGARFNLDPRRKHYPSLLCRRDGRRRLDYLLRCHDTALALGASVVSLWSGHDFEEIGFAAAFDLLVENLGELLDRCRSSGVAFAFEPEPGMLIETLEQYDRLAATLDRPGFGLALDLGHLLVTGEAEPEDVLRARGADALTIAIEDMRRGRHEHLPFGEGDLDLDAVIGALDDCGYSGLVAVELSRSSSDAVRIAAESLHELAVRRG